MLISIITPTFNSAPFLTETFISIKSQTYQNWEWIITDDRSTDNTWELLTKFAKEDSRIKIFRNDVNSGAAITRNNSLSQASGYFLAFIDADDLWVPEKLKKQIAFMGSHIDFSFTAYELISENGVPTNKFIDLHHSGSFSYEDMLRKKATLGCSTVMLRTKAFLDLQMPLIRTGQDYALWLKLLKVIEKAHLLNEPLTKYRIVSNSISRNKFRKARRQWQIYREVEKLDLLKALECFIFYAYRAIFR